MERLLLSLGWGMVLIGVVITALVISAHVRLWFLRRSWRR